MLKYVLPVCLLFMVKLFNQIFDTGDYPITWSSAVIVPLHKGGDQNIPNNYRGVSLLSINGKVFVRILDKRLSKCVEDNEHIVEKQAGSRQGYSTTDNMFVLYGIIQRYLLKRSGKLYVCFVDFQKALDKINRNMWNVLRKTGIGRKMLHILQIMYQSVTSCVRCSDGLTYAFDCPTGVRQGCVLSPTLFSFFVKE